MTGDVSIPLAFFGGILSFVSPCVLPLVPSYVSFVTGVSFEELTDERGARNVKKVIVLNSLMFILGFTTVFVVILGASAQLFGQLFMENRDVVRWIGGLAIIILGIHITGLINFSVLQKEKKVHLQEKPAGLFGAFLVGMGFAAGWTPCIGPILSAIFTVAATSDSSWAGISLFLAYSLGLAIPFMLTSLGINTFIKHFRKVTRHMRAISIFTGVFLVITGVLIFFNAFAMITTYLNTILPSIG